MNLHPGCAHGQGQGQGQRSRDTGSLLIQGVLMVKVKVKVKYHVIQALLWWHENRFFSQANSRIATKLAHDSLQLSLRPGCAHCKVKVKVKGHVIRAVYLYDCTKIASSSTLMAAS